MLAKGAPDIRTRRKQSAYRTVCIFYVTHCTQRTHDARTTPLLCQNDVATSFCHNNDVIAPCAYWVKADAIFIGSGIIFYCQFTLSLLTTRIPHGLVQNCSNSIANALELLQFCTKPWIWYLERHVLDVIGIHGYVVAFWYSVTS